MTLRKSSELILGNGSLGENYARLWMTSRAFQPIMADFQNKLNFNYLKNNKSITTAGKEHCKIDKLQNLAAKHCKVGRYAAENKPTPDHIDTPANILISIFLK